MCNNIAAVAYNGTLPVEHKEKLINIAKDDGYQLLFVEAEQDNKWINYETIHVPTNEEMVEHLKWE